MKKLLCLLCLGVAFAQDARVILLRPADATALRAAWNELQAAHAKFDGLKEDVAKRYGATWEQGWSGGVTFSSDFRAMVPKPTPPESDVGGTSSGHSQFPPPGTHFNSD